MKTPISYYGGKQNMVSRILPFIPKHNQYVEPFFGGGAVFWAKSPSNCEVINDLDNRVFNFWDVLKTDFDELQFLIQNTMHSEAEHRKAKIVLADENYDRIWRAWAFWVQTNMSFSSGVNKGFAFDNGLDNRPARASKTKFQRDVFTNKLQKRLEFVQIFNRDAVDLIQRKDSPGTFMYLDPPYANSHCGHYEAGKNVFYDLLDLLPSIKCKWLLSSYPSDELSNFRAVNGYKAHDIRKNLSVNGKGTRGQTKIECLTLNYDLEQTNLEF